MIQPSLDALLMTPVGRPMLPAPHLAATSAVQYCCPRSQHTQIQNIDPHSGLRQNRCRRTTFSVNRHPRLQAAFDNGCGSCQGKNNSGLSSFGMKTTYREPRCSIQRGSFLIPPSPGNNLQLPTLQTMSDR